MSTTTDLTLRASSMPLAIKCPASVRPPEGGVRINPRNEAADAGTAVHAAMQELIELGELETPVSQIAAAHGADPDDVQVLTAMTRSMLRHIQPWVGSTVAVEMRIQAPAPWGRLTGQADWIFLWSGDEKHLGLFDLKTGRMDSDHYAQMISYAVLAFYEMPYIERVTPIIGWLRDSEIETYTFTRDGAMEWIEQAGDSIANWDGTYEPGAHCEFCPRRHDCPARLALMRADIRELDDAGDEAAIDSMVGALVDAAEADPASADRLAELLAKAKSIEALADRMRKTARDRLAESGHPLQGEQHEISVSQVNKVELDAEAAWPVLLKVIGDAELRRLAKLPKTKTYDALRETAPRGKKKALVESVESELVGANALRTSSYQKLNVKRSKQSIEARGK